MLFPHADVGMMQRFSKLDLRSLGFRHLHRVWRHLRTLDRQRVVLATQWTLAGAAVCITVLAVVMWDEATRAAARLTLTPAVRSTSVLDARGRPAFSFFKEQRFQVSLHDVSPLVVEAVLAAEDRRFYHHRGLEARRVAAAAWANLRAWRLAQGGSSITQQLVRLLCLERKRTFRRKAREAFLSLAVERRFTKDEILTAYLNSVYFGNGYYGIEAAARGYFDKPASSLEAAEAATLAALIRNPSVGQSEAAQAVLKGRRLRVLRAMSERGAIAPGDVAALSAAPLFKRVGSFATLGATFDSSVGGYFKAAVHQELVERFGLDLVERGGLRVYTRFDPDLQRFADRAIVDQIAAIERTRRERPGPRLQGALVALDPPTGLVRALVGGRDFHASPFDRARQARRQPGSAFKPLVYAAALELGYTPATILTGLNTPLPLNSGYWLPRGAHELDTTTVREALVVSSNRAAVHLLDRIGQRSLVTYAHRFGLDELPEVPSLALGTAEVSLIDLTAAYSVFVNGGIRAAPGCIERVEDGNGLVLFQHDGNRSAVVSRTTAFFVASMLADVMNRGTGATARAHGFRLPAGGKTGTSQDAGDVWFIGFTPSLLAGVWFGFDRAAPISRHGSASTVAVPAWAAFMRDATKGDKPAWLEPPSNLREVLMCRVSGQQATDACRQAVLDYDSPSPSLPSMSLQTDAVAQEGSASTPPRRPGVYREYAEMGREPGPCPVHSLPFGIGAPHPPPGF